MEANNKAAMREERAPKPDQNWKDICAKCNDGDIEPRFCRYYGEPNGCNSPIYGEHPDFENTAATRKVLEVFIQLADDGMIQPRAEGDHDEHCFVVVQGMARAALSAPPRNCDVGTVAEQMERFEAYCNAHEPCESCPLARPRVCPSCGVDWAQMPYNEKEE